MHAPVELRVTTEGILELDYDGASAWGHHSYNCTPSAMQGALWVQLTQTLICNDKVNDGAYFGLRPNFPPGTWTNHNNPAASTGAAWGYLIPSFTGFIRSLSRGLQARGYVEEVLAPYGFTTNVFQGGGIDHFGKQSATTNFGLSCVGGGGKMVADGLDYGAAMWNPEGDMGDMEMWELLEPFLYLGQRVKPNTAGAGTPPRRLGLRVPAPVLEDAVLRDPEHRQRHRVRELRPVGRLPRRVGLPPQHPPDELLRGRRAPRSPTRRTSRDPEDSALARMITGRRDFDQETTTLPEAMTTGDLYLCYFRGAAGVGDPLERPYDAVMADVDGEYLLERFAEPVYGVIPGDPSATERPARAQARRARGRGGARARVDGARARARCWPAASSNRSRACTRSR